MQDVSIIKHSQDLKRNMQHKEREGEMFCLYFPYNWYQILKFFPGNVPVDYKEIKTCKTKHYQSNINNPSQICVSSVSIQRGEKYWFLEEWVQMLSYQHLAKIQECVVVSEKCQKQIVVLTKPNVFKTMSSAQTFIL